MRVRIRKGVSGYRKIGRTDNRMCPYCKVQQNIGNYNDDNDDDINSNNNNNNNNENTTKSNSKQAIKQTLIVIAPQLLQMY